MDEEASIFELAKSLKTLHLVATMEEALARAREIILSSKGGDEPLNKLTTLSEKDPVPHSKEDVQEQTDNVQNPHKKK